MNTCDPSFTCTKTFYDSMLQQPIALYHPPYIIILLFGSSQLMSLAATSRICPELQGTLVKINFLDLMYIHTTSFINLYMRSSNRKFSDVIGLGASLTCSYIAKVTQTTSGLFDNKM